MTQPLVSICIPSYNSGLFIRETIESALNQSYSNIEVVVSDDCSTDATVDIVKSMTDQRIVLYENVANLGVESNWNNTLRLSKGVFVKVMGADDILNADCILEQVMVLTNPENNDVSLVSCHKTVINERGSKIISVKFPGKGKIDGLQALRQSIRRGTNIIGEPAAGLFRSELLKETGVFNGENVYLIDLDLWSRLLKIGKLFVVDKPLYSFRISSRSISASMGLRQYTLFNSFVEKLFNDRTFGITRTDQWIARVMSIAMVLARQIFHARFFMQK